MDRLSSEELTEVAATCEVPCAIWNYYDAEAKDEKPVPSWADGVLVWPVRRPENHSPRGLGLLEGLRSDQLLIALLSEFAGFHSKFSTTEFMAPYNTTISPELVPELPGERYYLPYGPIPPACPSPAYFRYSIFEGLETDVDGTNRRCGSYLNVSSTPPPLIPKPHRWTGYSNSASNSTAPRYLASSFLSSPKTGPRKTYLEALLALNDTFPLAKYGKFYGNAAISQPPRKSQWNTRGTNWKLQEISKYPFYLAFENSLCAGATEKAFHALAAGTVPVYLGHKQSLERLVPRNSTLFVEDFPTPRALVERLRYLIAHPDEYAQLHAWRDQPFDFPELEIDWARRNVLCTACQAVHDARSLGRPARARPMAECKAGRFHG